MSPYTVTAHYKTDDPPFLTCLPLRDIVIIAYLSEYTRWDNKNKITSIHPILQEKLTCDRDFPAFFYQQTFFSNAYFEISFLSRNKRTKFHHNMMKFDVITLFGHYWMGMSNCLHSLAADNLIFFSLMKATGKPCRYFEVNWFMYNAVCTLSKLLFEIFRLKFYLNENIIGT